MKIDLKDVAAVRAIYEERNKHLNLYYTRETFETFLDVY